MTIKTRVMTALTGMACYFGDWYPDAPGEKPPACYVTFTTMTTPDAHNDDKRTSWAHYVYLTLWSAGAYQAQRAAIISALETAGFANIEIKEDAQSRTDMNQCSFTWKYVEEV